MQRAAGDPGASSWLAAEADLRRLQVLTGDDPVLMGRRTWETVPRALRAGRQCFVLTRSRTSIPGAVACTSLDEALTLASVLRPGNLFVLGGAAVFEQGLRVADRLYVARIEPGVGAGAAPAIDDRVFELVRRDCAASLGPSRCFEEYRRKRFH